MINLSGASAFGGTSRTTSEALSSAALSELEAARSSLSPVASTRSPVRWGTGKLRVHVALRFLIGALPRSVFCCVPSEMCDLVKDHVWCFVPIMGTASAHDHGVRQSLEVIRFFTLARWRFKSQTLTSEKVLLRIVDAVVCACCPCDWMILIGWSDKQINRYAVKP
jgi:hypothetical protein